MKYIPAVDSNEKNLGPNGMLNAIKLIPNGRVTELAMNCESIMK